MPNELIYQWSVNGAWRRGRKALVDGGTLWRYGLDGTQWLMRVEPSGELTLISWEQLVVAPEPGPTKGESNVPA